MEKKENKWLNLSEDDLIKELLGRGVTNETMMSIVKSRMDCPLNQKLMRVVLERNPSDEILASILRYSKEESLRNKAGEKLLGCYCGKRGIRRIYSRFMAWMKDEKPATEGIFSQEDEGYLSCIITEVTDEKLKEAVARKLLSRAGISYIENRLMDLIKNVKSEKIRIEAAERLLKWEYTSNKTLESIKPYIQDGDTINNIDRKINYPREREEIVELLLNTGESKFSHTIENVAFITEG